MRDFKKLFFFGIVLTGVLLCPSRLFAFALLGPAEPWMQVSNGLSTAVFQSGPMDIGHGYRWNVPVLTYGFDESFLSYFGSNGVAAVESAIKVLNDLEPASSLVITNYPLDTLQYNYAAQDQSLIDLKSHALHLLLGQMGLTSGQQSMFVIRQWTNALSPVPNNSAYEFGADGWGAWAIPDYVVIRNFDPLTLQPSHSINGTSFAGYIFQDANSLNRGTFVLSTDPFSADNPAVADRGGGFGEFYTSLTRDDVGGLVYLLTTNRVNYENLLQDVVGAGTNSGSVVNGAWRPGVDKITFVPHPFDTNAGTFLIFTNDFVDHYFSNNILHTQSLRRVSAQPDILFNVLDYRIQADREGFTPSVRPTNWLNLSDANGLLGQAGPGIIRPPARVTFKRLGQFYAQLGYVIYPFEEFSWGPFDGSTNPPITYPVQPENPSAPLSMKFFMSLPFNQTDFSIFEWPVSGATGQIFVLQTSTNLVSWSTIITATNRGLATSFIAQPNEAKQFYRVIPQ